MDNFRISIDKASLDIPLIHRFLSEHSTWAKGIPLERYKSPSSIRSVSADSWEVHK